MALARYENRPDTPPEREIDTLMERQLVTLDYSRPHVLVAARSNVGNFRPSVLDHQTLWNVEEWFLHPATLSSR